MVVRIVRMQFRLDETESFEELFRNTYEQIRNFEGCLFLELYKDTLAAGVYYTMSKWEKEDDLEKYRESGLFRQTWAITKTLFAGPPMAYSLQKEVADAINPF